MAIDALKGAKLVGQSFWTDYLHGKAIENGELKAEIADGGITGLTSNPAIFEKAMSGDDYYNRRIDALISETKQTADSVYELISVADIKAAAKLLRGVYDSTGGRDGYASLEVSPNLADHGAGTVAEAHRLWKAIEEPNAMIKVPATEAGITAVRQLIGEGINVNVTLLFSVDVYLQVLDAYMAGLENLSAKGGDVAKVASVASFFVSRVDQAVDEALANVPNAQVLVGKVGVANAKCAYKAFKNCMLTERWQALAKKGAHVQRLLWASTSVKNPAYPELLYVEGLMGPNTVNTLSPATYEAFKLQGKPKDQLSVGLDEAAHVMASLTAAGISYSQIAAKLTTEGIATFLKSFDKLRQSIEIRLTV